MVTIFEGWSNSKLDKYNVAMDKYDHIDVGNIPAIVLNEFYKNPSPYITFIHLWDKIRDYLTYHMHYPLRIGHSEPGIGSNEDDQIIITMSTYYIKMRFTKEGGRK